METNSNLYICEFCKKELKTIDKSSHELECKKKFNTPKVDDNSNKVFNSNNIISSEQITYNCIGKPKMNSINNTNNIKLDGTRIINNNNNFSISSFALSSSELNHYEMRPENPNIKAKKDITNSVNYILRQFPENKINNLNILNDENKRCIICLEEYKINDETIVLPCFHFFHKNCIINWTKNKAICPLCKFNFKNYK